MLRTIVVTALIASPAFGAPRPAPLPTRPVVEDYFGTKLTDNYRFMEKLDDPVVVGWMKAEGHYTRSVFDSIPGRAALAARIAAFTGGFDVVNSYQHFGRA